MKFVKLEILNLASLDKNGGETICFEEGALGNSTIFSIVGPTGSGKSTILDAICLALYNRAPRYPRKKGDRNQGIVVFGELEDGERNRLAPTDARNILTRGKKVGYSKLTFLANNGNVYRAEWHVTFQRVNYKEATTLLYHITTENGKPSEKAVEWDELPDIIGLDYDQFLRTVLIAQGSFANFLTAKEDERYELLEKLIGCEELYAGIAAKIKKEKDAAAEVFNQVAAECSAQEKDIISDETELTALKEKIVRLEAEEKLAKKELDKVKEALAWYDAEKKHIENLAKYETEFKKASDALEGIKEQAGRLALHDATLPAVAIYKEIKDSESKISQFGEELKTLANDVTKIESQIKNENAALEILNLSVQNAKYEFKKQKPHIDEARKIMAQLAAAKTISAEKENDAKNARAALDEALKAVSANAVAVDKAGKAVQDAEKNLSTLEEKLASEGKTLKENADAASGSYNSEVQKLEGRDAESLQNAKANAEKVLADLTSAIQIQSGIVSKKNNRQAKVAEQQKLSARNDKIASELKLFNLDALKTELDTLNKTYTLMTSENWNRHRDLLVEGSPCPLCGASQHPYCSENVVKPVIDEMWNLIRSKKACLSEQESLKQRLTEEYSTNNGTLDGIRRALFELDSELDSLLDQWREIRLRYADWPQDVDTLRSMVVGCDKTASDASAALTTYNLLVKTVEKLRKSKENAEKTLRDHIEKSAKLIESAKNSVNDAKNALAAESGKTENLIAQQVEKVTAAKAALEASEKAAAEVTYKIVALKAEIGDEDPDAFEKKLTAVIETAEKKVLEKKEEIGKLAEGLTMLKGKEEAVSQSRKDEATKLSVNSKNLDQWILSNNGTLADIVHLYSATDNWEDIRSHQKELGDTYTAAKTTLDNERVALVSHQENKPAEEQDTLSARKEELEGLSNDELVNSKARLQRHEAAVRQMGDLFAKKMTSENMKREWDEISDAVGGSEGKTLRKIAQCYTLRFLIEHANAEIRKFNSRYELMQVKNSLGIRVIDHDRADDVRDTTSLSGGETFIVSLGLALGLSSISSRNISFENLFIDEGFGTLDPGTLATVINSLAMLQSSQGKKVGVISHTDTMFELITTQIRIIKNGDSGSSHIEIYPK